MSLQRCKENYGSTEWIWKREELEHFKTLGDGYAVPYQPAVQPGDPSLHSGHRCCQRKATREVHPEISQPDGHQVVPMLFPTILQGYGEWDRSYSNCISFSSYWSVDLFYWCCSRWWFGNQQRTILDAYLRVCWFCVSVISALIPTIPGM